MSSKVTQVRMFRYHVPSILGGLIAREFFFDRKFTIRTITSCPYLLVEVFIKAMVSVAMQSRGKQCSFMSLSTLLTAQTITVVEWNSTINRHRQIS